MSQHTPGPWVASQYMDTNEWGVLTSGKGLDDLLNNQIVVGLSSRITKANARLIAAAPDLLDELKQLVDLIGRLPENAWDDVQGFDVNHAFSRASKLLASLEGQ